MPEPVNIYEKVATRVESTPAPVAKDLRAMMQDIPELRPFIIGAAIRGLGARKCFFDMKKNEMVYEPDFGSQAKAVAFLAAYVDGLPVQSTINLNVEGATKKGKLSVEEALRRSPALVEAMKKEIKRIEAAPGRPLADFGSPGSADPVGVATIELE